jgi:outer membrane protein OmpA-like peptidoglycan-associated protein
MRWLVGIALASVTGIGVAAAQTETSRDPSVTVDLRAIPNSEKQQVYTGERVVFPLIYPDGSLAATPRTGAQAQSEPVKLTPPDGETATAAPAVAAESSSESTPTETQPSESQVAAESDSEQTAALVVPPESPSGPSSETTRVPTPSLKPKSITQPDAATQPAAIEPPTSEAPAPATLFTQPPPPAEEQREAKPAAELAAISPELISPPASKVPQILFVAGRTELDGAGMAVLDAVALELSKSKERIELQAFASTAPDQSDSAKSLSLRRALNVRTYLIEKGIDRNRIIIKARGDATEGTPERVDIVRAAG